MGNQSWCENVEGKLFQLEIQLLRAISNIMIHYNDSASSNDFH